MPSTLTTTLPAAPLPAARANTAQQPGPPSTNPHRPLAGLIHGALATHMRRGTAPRAHALPARNAWD